MNRAALVRGAGLGTLAQARGLVPEWRLDFCRRPGRGYGAVLAQAGDPEGAALAGRLGARWIGVADGFVRSAGASAPPLSIIVEDGRAFTGEVRSSLDRLLSETGWADETLLSTARLLLEFKGREGLSRVNDGAPAADWLSRGGQRVLVVDRTADDRFLGRPALPRAAYEAMFQAARAEYPRARIVVWRDPSQRDGLPPELLAEAEAVLDGGVDVVDLIGRMDAVYTVGGLIGLEALFCGKPVTCFGRPFYAGLGLTDDRAAPPVGACSREALFAAAYLLVPRYIDPLTGEACSPEVAFERLAAFKRHAARVAGRWAGVNIAPPKQAVLRAFLAGPLSSYSSRARPGAVSVAWASHADARRLGSAFVEDGFIRSRGLGSSFHPASSLVVDRRGIYYDPSRPSDLEHMLNTATFDAALLARARRLREQVVTLGLSKYNLGGAPAGFAKPQDRIAILVPGQVEDDASVLAGGGGWTNLDLLQRVRRDNPDAFIVYKEHPDVAAGNRRGRIAGAEALADMTTREGDIVEWLERVDEVHTISSLAGFEALLRGKAVTTYGWPFYAGWGLTRDLGQAPAPSRRRLALDELTAGALILYPLYLDPTSRLPCSPEVFVDRLGKTGRRAALGPLMRFARAARETLFPRRPPRY